MTLSVLKLKFNGWNACTHISIITTLVKLPGHNASKCGCEAGHLKRSGCGKKDTEFCR